jgi:RHH-type proline utilization regulon transcriptional repressor/proline dehydrogenase/delta 1-pyrroline-5-carboxylate dehydrogenase
VPAEIFTAAAKTGADIARTPVYMNGRIELLQSLRQQPICNNDHRCGNLNERSLD